MSEQPVFRQVATLMWGLHLAEVSIEPIKAFPYCHYFDVSTNPATGQAFWTAKSHVDLTGEAMKIDGKWLLTRVSTTAVGIPIPPAVGVPVP